MQINETKVGDFTQIELVGDLDAASSPALEERLTALIAGGTHHLVLECSRLDYISSAGLRVLLVVAKRVQQAKGKVVLFALVPNVREVFSISGFDKIFQIQSDMAGAVAAVR